MRRIFTISSIVAVLILSVFTTVSASAARVPCDKSRTVTPVVSLKDGSYGKLWSQSYGTALVSYRWDRKLLTITAGARLKQLRVDDTSVSLPVRSYWIREAYYTCRSGRLRKIGRARSFYVNRGSNLIPPDWKTLRIDSWPRDEWLGMAFAGMWLTSRITIETPDGKRSSIRASIRIRPPKGAVNPNN